MSCMIRAMVKTHSAIRDAKRYERWPPTTRVEREPLMEKLRAHYTRARQQVEPVVERGQQHWVGRLVNNYLEDDADGLASMLAYAALFSLMPILTVTFLVIITLLQVT